MRLSVNPCLAGFVHFTPAVFDIVQVTPLRVFFLPYLSVVNFLSENGAVAKQPKFITDGPLYFRAPLAVNSAAHFALSWRLMMQVTAEPFTAHWMFLD